MKMYDLSLEKGWMNNVELGSDKIPEISDFNVDEEVELHLVCKVRGVRKVQEPQEASAVPEGTKAEKKEDKKPPKEYIKADLQITSCGIMNTKAPSKDAERLGLDKATYDEIQKKREAKKKAAE